MLIYDWLRHVKWRAKGGRPPLPISNQNTRLTAGWSNNSSQISINQKHFYVFYSFHCQPCSDKKYRVFSDVGIGFKGGISKFLKEKKKTVRRNQREAVRKIIHRFRFIRPTGGHNVSGTTGTQYRAATQLFWKIWKITPLYHRRRCRGRNNNINKCCLSFAQHVSVHKSKHNDSTGKLKLVSWFIPAH